MSEKAASVHFCLISYLGRYETHVHKWYKHNSDCLRPARTKRVYADIVVYGCDVTEEAPKLRIRFQLRHCAGIDLRGKVQLDQPFDHNTSTSDLRVTMKSETSS